VDVPGYVLREVLGRGGSATVHRATQVSTGRDVAVKVFDDDVTVDPGTVRAVRGLADHPNVVGLIDVGTTEAGAPFVVMELVTAGSVGDRLRAFGPVSPTEAARIGAEVADALEAAHGAGIVHGQISPDNILVARRGRALLADFALGPGAAAGSGAGAPADDVHALGVTLHTLVAGEPPADDASPLPPEVPFALVDLIGACLAADPAERPPLPELARRLEGLAGSQPVPPPPSIAEDDTPDDRPAPSFVPKSRSERDFGTKPAPAQAMPVARMAIVAVLIALSLVAAAVLAVVFGD
jgi:serine/threonine protein kinase